ncbi:tRNA (adenosine(37)-N6)-threonylcarbamoyltransferase complex dimerization subunit type 1 TsaB [Phosphitispora fastidiosa]|uniref:tRNA (adenosine(37)-N6)-threonylcarbamoyltransferase complex dimerization subunit type 1 TsaB n=1 Tax=Phosphitispora fastidiosa TaxID=2837202 RepID=UPI001E631412|nr:tRNA (adenosine(37)-N6)-threonylcarbamoyltransferase complex dimerization subunit type 1 TsaB [Phosphitispora fastidiosa]MBU7008439.1 tRNA threonylcarbamoyladenosine biosynthesis protein TsaB [Phosphitispora fastidiosa]
MYILGIDTATRVAGAAVAGDDRLVSERFIHNLKTHSQNIIPMIQQVLDDAGIKPAELDGIAVTSGPGSFTGLRIGMAVAKTMGQALDIPVVGVSTLRVLAWNYYRASGLICPVLDARRNEVYAGIYGSGPEGLEELVRPAAMPVEQLLDELSRYRENVIFLGDGVPVYRDTIITRLGSRALFGTMINSFPRAGAAAELGMVQLQQGQTEDYTFMQPVYLRKSEAETTWEKKHGQ